MICLKRKYLMDLFPCFKQTIVNRMFLHHKLETYKKAQAPRCLLGSTRIGQIFTLERKKEIFFIPDATPVSSYDTWFGKPLTYEWPLNWPPYPTNIP